jgi:hypothetical protein
VLPQTCPDSGGKITSVENRSIDFRVLKAMLTEKSLFEVD